MQIVSLTFLFFQMDELEEDQMDQGTSVSKTTDKNAMASLIMDKLQELAEIFEQKNEDYMAMEERSDRLNKVGVAY